MSFRRPDPITHRPRTLRDPRLEDLGTQPVYVSKHLCVKTTLTHGSHFVFRFTPRFLYVRIQYTSYPIPHTSVTHPPTGLPDEPFKSGPTLPTHSHPYSSSNPIRSGHGPQILTSPTVPQAHVLLPCLLRAPAVVNLKVDGIG